MFLVLNNAAYIVLAAIFVFTMEVQATCPAL